MSGRISVLLVDDHAVVREGYRRLLERQQDIEVRGEATSAAEALRLVEEIRPTVTVMDLTLPSVNGLDATRQILQQQPGARVLVFSMHENAVFARRALKAGALGYVTKSSAPAELVRAVRIVAAGRTFLSADIAQQLALDSIAPQVPVLDALTAREREILRRLVAGQTVRQIADELSLTVKTVANHQSQIRQKLGASTAVQLLRAAEGLDLDLREP